MHRFNNNEELIKYIEGGNSPEFLFFYGGQETPNKITKACLSQWYPSPFEVGLKFATAEHCMMAGKAMLFDDQKTHDEILLANTPREAKALGRNVQNFDQAVWDEHKFRIVVATNFEKFKQNPELRDFLIKTGNKVLVEASPYDTVWGIGMGEGDSGIEDPKNWKGENLLGYALMRVRYVLNKHGTSKIRSTRPKNPDTAIAPYSFLRKEKSGRL